MCVDTSMTQWGDNQPLQGWGSFKAPWPLRGGAERNSSRYHMDNLSAPIQSKLLGVASWATLMTMQFFSHLLSLHSYCFNKEPMKWANTWSRKGQVTRFTSGSSLNVTGKLMRLKWDHLRSLEIIWDHVVNVSLLFLCQHLVGDAQRLAWHLPGLAIILRRLVPTFPIPTVTTVFPDITSTTNMANTTNTTNTFKILQV